MIQEVLGARLVFFGSGEPRMSDVRGGLEKRVLGSARISLGTDRDKDDDSFFPFDDSSSLDVTSSLYSTLDCLGVSDTLSTSSSGSFGKSGRTGL